MYTRRQHCEGVTAARLDNVYIPVINSFIQTFSHSKQIPLVIRLLSVCIAEPLCRDVIVVVGTHYNGNVA